MKLQYFILAMLCPLLSMCQTITIKGKVVDEEGRVVVGAVVKVVNGERREVNGKKERVGSQESGVWRTTVSDERGEFLIMDTKVTDSIIVTAVGYETAREVNNERGQVTITLKKKVTPLDEVMVIAYGNTTRRLNTGNVTRVDASHISKQPVSNILATLDGVATGLLVTQTNGVPGSAIKVEIRGKTSVGNISTLVPVSNDPLFIIDGIPYATGNNSINQLSSTATQGTEGGGLSPFNSLNPGDIESIEILKDADATSIYGSRGSNGVILITTKKGKAGKAKFTVNAYTGNSRPTKLLPLLNTEQYLQVRKEAFGNDGTVMTNTNAYDLLLFDSTRYTNFYDLLLGNKARSNDMQASVSGGSSTTQFRVGTGYHHETTVYPGDMADRKGNLQMSLKHQALNKRFELSFTGLYGYDENNLVIKNMNDYLLLPPNYPAFFDSSGNLVWQYKGRNLINPFSYLLQGYTATTENLNANLQLSFILAKGFMFRTSMGYNHLQHGEVSKNPLKSQSPGSTSASAQFSNSDFRNWIIEPQLSYGWQKGKHAVKLLAGATFQRNSNQGSQVTGIGYVNDALLSSITAAAILSNASNRYEVYKYAAGFGRLNYQYNDKYILNISGRRDGSSRFGPGKQFSNFGAAGVAWLFSNEKFMRSFSFISFAKLRGSYGTAGNDKIGDYRYLNLFSPNQYQGSGGLSPTALFNPDYRWELNRKMEGGIDIGFLQDRILLSAVYFNHRSDNQLVQYQLPNQTGFSYVIANFPAVVQNSGWEFESSGQLMKTKKINWQASFNISFPKNKLLSFPGIESSSYSSLVVGAPLTVYSGIHFLGVDPQTGLYMFTDKNGDPISTVTTSASLRESNAGNLDPSFYGGFKNSISFCGFEAVLFFSFRKQRGINYLYQLASRIVPGTINNIPTAMLDRWQQPDDAARFAMYTQSTSSAAYRSYSQFANNRSEGKYSDASFLRLKNLSVSYTIPSKFTKPLHIESCQFYFHSQNVFTLTKYEGADPENQNFNVLPPLKTFTVGLQLNF